LQILVLRCFSGHGEKTISILVEFHSKRKEDSFLCMKDIRSINVELAVNQDMFFFLFFAWVDDMWLGKTHFQLQILENSPHTTWQHHTAPARDSSPHPHSTTQQAPLWQKSSMGCTILRLTAAAKPAGQQQHGLHNSPKLDSTCSTPPCLQHTFAQQPLHLFLSTGQQLLLTTTPPAATCSC
jgi:hypothetical protein